MGHKLIEQPNGNFSIYSNTSDTVIGHNLTEDDVRSYYMERAIERSKEETQRWITQVREGKDFYPMSWDEIKQFLSKEEIIECEST